MEAFIIFIIISIIGTVIDRVNKSKESNENSKNPSQKHAPKPVPTKAKPAKGYKAQPVKPVTSPTKKPTFEEFAREMLGDVKPVAREVVSEPVKSPPPEPKRRETVERAKREPLQNRSTRPALMADRQIVKVEKAEQETSNTGQAQQQLMQAIVMAEILGKPKSKQQRVR